MICVSRENLQRNKVGAKAYNLARLSLNKFNVPVFLILDTDVFWDFLGEERKAYKELLVNYESTKLPEIRKIIEKGMNMERKERYKNIEELEKELTN